MDWLRGKSRGSRTSYQPRAQNTCGTHRYALQRRVFALPKCPYWGSRSAGFFLMPWRVLRRSSSLCPCSTYCLIWTRLWAGFEVKFALAHALSTWIYCFMVGGLLKAKDYLSRIPECTSDGSCWSRLRRSREKWFFPMEVGCHPGLMIAWTNRYRAISVFLLRLMGMQTRASEGPDRLKFRAGNAHQSLRMRSKKITHLKSQLTYVTSLRNASDPLWNAPHGTQTTGSLTRGS